MVTSSLSKHQRFGRYLILDHLVDGGMAKICRARYLGEQADKIVAIKMIQPKYSKDKNFRTMFLDEIKVTFGLIHSNIVQTYDYGIHDNKLYVAMEYCDGKNLKEYLDKLKSNKFIFPVEISVYIISQACQGLHYAHTYVDKLTGKKTKIIHRDISPHNIMLTYDGSVKIIDFGIAKADSNSEETQTGTIKGKLSYLAPEYLEGLDLDARYDEFALGITLWEMLCSRKLFKAPNDLAILKKIQECKIPPPSSINPNVPKELDEIVLKALNKDRNQRYENLEQFNRALMKFLFLNYPDFNASDLSYFAKQLFRDDILKDREKLYEHGKINIRPFIEELKNETVGGIITSDGNWVINKETGKRENIIDFGFSDQGGSKKAIRDRRRDKKAVGDSRRKEDNSPSDDENEKLELDRTKASKKGLIETSGEQKNALHARPEARRLSPKLIQSEAEKKDQIEGESEKNSAYTNLFVESEKKDKDEKLHESVNFSLGVEKISHFINVSRKTVFAILTVLLVVAVPYFFPTDKVDKLVLDTKGPEIKNEGRIPSSGKGEGGEQNRGEEALLGVINLVNYDRRDVLRVLIDNQQVEVGYFGEINKVPVARELTLRIERRGRQHFVKKFSIEKGSTSEPSLKVEIKDTPREDFGYIYASDSCSPGKVYFSLYGEERVEKLPIAVNKQVPIPVGKLQVYIERDAYSGIRSPASIKISAKGNSVDLCEKL